MPAQADIREENRHEGDEDDLQRKVGAGVRDREGELHQDADADKGKRDSVGAHHPLAVLLDLPIARSEKRGDSGDDPRGGLQAARQKEVRQHVGDAAIVGEDDR